METIELKKALKSYLKAQKLNKINNKESAQYLHQSLKYINKIKNKNSKYKDILLETENECNYLLNNMNDLFQEIDNGNLKFFKNNIFTKKQLLVYNKEGNTPLHYTIKHGDISILKILLKYNISIDIVNLKGHTLLEYACLLKDPNSIKFLINYGADMKKHLFFRQGKMKLHLGLNNIDIACITKILILNSYKKKYNKKLNFLEKYFNLDDKCGIGNFKYRTVFIGLGIIKNIDTYIDIIKDELSYKLNNKFGCYENKYEIIIYNLIPFIEYNFNIGNNILINELKYLILKLKLNNKKILEQVWEKYIKSGLFKEDYIGIQIKKVLKNIK